MLKTIKQKHFICKTLAHYGIIAYLCTRKQETNGAIAQLVEQRTENPCVPGSIPGGTTPPFISPVLFAQAAGFSFCMNASATRSGNHSARRGAASRQQRLTGVENTNVLMG